eukprot:1006997-Pyramimonas_sp.AAC.1
MAGSPLVQRGKSPWMPCRGPGRSRRPLQRKAVAPRGPERTRRIRCSPHRTCMQLRAGAREIPNE